MAKVKRYSEEKPRQTELKGGWWGPFMEDWGRLVIPLTVIAALFLLHRFGIMDDRGIGYVIGLIVLVGSAGAAGAIMWREELPKWARISAIVAGVVLFVGVLWPFTRNVYPGTPDFEQTLSKDSEAKTTAISGGLYLVEVRATEAEGGAGKQARYTLMIGDEKVTGTFSDVFRSVRGKRNMSRQVEVRHLSEQHMVTLPAGELPLKLTHLDPAFGSEVRVRLYSILIPPWLMYAVAGLVLLYAAFLDGWFQNETEKWRISPWLGLILTFLIFFHWDFNADDVTRHAIGATVVAGIVGFLGGWLVSLLGRLIVGKVRTRLS